MGVRYQLQCIEIILNKRQNFRTFQTEGICREKIKYSLDDGLGPLLPETTVGKGENVGFQHLLFFSQCFLKTIVFKGR